MKFAGDSVEKKMLRYLFATMLICSVVVGSYTGCGPRVKVAGKQVLEKIDKLLGEMNVQLQRIEDKRDQLTDQSNEIKKKLYVTEARLDQMKKEQTARDTEAASLKSDLAQLKGYLSDAKGEGEVEIKGQPVSKERLIGWATDKAKLLKKINGRTESKAKLITIHEKNLAVYKSQVDISKTNLDKLNEQIEEIKTKKELLDDTRRASLLDGKSVSINDEFESLTKDVDDLLVSVDAEVRLENDSLNERIADAEAAAGSATLDELLDDKSDVDKALSEIDALLE